MDRYIAEEDYKSKVDQCKYIFDSLSDEEKKYMGGHYVDSPALVYRKVAQSKDTKEPVGYVELYDSAKLGYAQGDVNLSVAIHPNWRGQNIGTMLIKDAIHWFKDTEYETMSYITHIDNEPSRRLAEKCGFVFLKQDNRKKEIIHIITNPSRLKTIGEGVSNSDKKEVNSMDRYIAEGYYKSKSDQCRSVYDTFSDEEKKFYGRIDNDDGLVYCKIAQDKTTKEAIGFLKVRARKATCTLSLGVHANYRRQDLGTVLVKDAIHWFKNTEYQAMFFNTHIDNTASIRLAEKCGFMALEQDNRRKILVHIITNPNRLKAIGEEMDQMVKEMSGGSGIVGMEINDVSVQTSSPGMFIIGYGERDNFVGDGGDNSGYAISSDIFTKHIYRRKNGKTVKEDYSFLDNRLITLYEYKGDPARFYLLLKEAELGVVDESTDDYSYFYEVLSGNEMICEDQIDYDSKFACWNPARELSMLRSEDVTMVEEFNKLMGKENYTFPAISNEDLELERELREYKDSYRLYEDIEGYYIFDEDTNLRTPSIDRDIIKAMII